MREEPFGSAYALRLRPSDEHPRTGEHAKEASTTAPNATPDIAIRPATLSDRESVISVVSEIFQRDSTDRYEWLYLANPHGRALSWLAIENASGTPLGVTSMFPRKVVVNGRVRIGSIGGDCYVMPAARRSGLATRLHQASFKEMNARGVEFMYGPPWAKNLRALVRAGSTEVATYREYSRLLTSNAAILGMSAIIPQALHRIISPRLMARLTLSPYQALQRLCGADEDGCALEPAERFGDEWQAFFEDAVAGYSTCCVRDADYLNWRYIDRPIGSHDQEAMVLRHRAKLCGLVVVEERPQSLLVADLFTRVDSKGMEVALQLTAKEALQRGYDRVTFKTLPNPRLTRRLFKLGFLPGSGRGFQVACGTDDPDRPVLHKGSEWYFTCADQDPRPSHYEVVPPPP